MPVLNQIPFNLDRRALLSRLHVDADDTMAQEILDLAEVVEPVIAPKAMYDVCYVEDRGEDTVTFGGTTFSSRVMRANLDEVERVFPYVATCGPEVDALGLAQGDFLVGFWIDTIKETALGAASRTLRAHIKETHLLGRTASMAPGSGDPDTWPIQQQKLLFPLLGDVEGAIGVRLTDSCLMIPNKSVSGILFATEVAFESCMVCQRPNCPGRRAHYDPDFMATRYSHGDIGDD